MRNKQKKFSSKVMKDSIISAPKAGKHKDKRKNRLNNTKKNSWQDN